MMSLWIPTTSTPRNADSAKLKITTSLFCGLALAWSLVSPIWAQECKIDLRPNQAVKLKMASEPLELGVIRLTNREAGATILPELFVGDIITLRLFDDVEYSVRLTEALQNPLGGVSFLATINGYDEIMNAVVIQSEEGLQIDIRDLKNSRVYTVSASENYTIVREIDPNVGEVNVCKPLVPEPRFPEAESDEDSSEIVNPSASKLKLASADQSSTFVDILVAYDAKAAIWAKSNGGGLNNFAQTAVAKMNTALANNGLDSRFRFRLVGTIEVSVFKTDVNDALYAIENDEPGWSAIKTKRNEVYADIVTTMIDTGSAHGTLGVGWALSDGSPVAYFSESAYNVCAIRSVAQSHTMTHEVGHNMGAGHATAVNENEISPGPQYKSYSAGYYFKVNSKKYHTIMAYNFDGFGNSYTEAPLFSSPNSTWKGVIAGDAMHDNARTIKETYAEVAKWREKVVVPSPSSIAISGSSSVTSGSNATYTCKATMSNGTIKTVIPTWSISSGSSYASIIASGKLMANTVTSSQTVTIKASYTEGGVTKTATKFVTIVPRIPAAPTWVNASKGTFSKEIFVTWEKSSDAASYDIYRSTTAMRPTMAMKTNVTSSYYSDTTAIPGMTYYYWVSAVNSAGTSYSSYDTGYRAIAASISNENDYFTAIGGTGKTTVTADTSWSATANVSWITFTTSSGSGSGSVVYAVAANTSTESRKGTITITFGAAGISHSLKKTITIWQLGVMPDLAFAQFTGWDHDFSVFTIARDGDKMSTPIFVFNKGEGFSLVYGYANFGDGIAVGTITNRIEILDINDKSVYEFDREETIELSQYRGVRTVFSDELWKNLKTGAYLAKVSLDAGNQFEEEREGNNVGTFRFAVRDPVSLNEALDNISLNFVTAASGGWFGTKGIGADGVEAAQCTHIGNSSTNSMATTVSGPGTISFKWKVSSEKGCDELSFFVDGSKKASLSGTGGGWNEQSYSLSSGTHTLTWSYCKNNAGSDGGDCGWVDQVVWMPVGGTYYTVRFAKDGGTDTQTFKCPRDFVFNLPGNMFTPPAGKRFVGWKGSNGKRYDEKMLVYNLVPVGEVFTLTAIWE